MKNHSSDFKFKEIMSESKTMSHFSERRGVINILQLCSYRLSESDFPSDVLSVFSASSSPQGLSHLSPQLARTTALLSTTAELKLRSNDLPKVSQVRRRADAFHATEPSSVDISRDAPKSSMKSQTGCRTPYFKRSITSLLGLLARIKCTRNLTVVLACGVRSQGTPQNE